MSSIEGPFIGNGYLKGKGPVAVFSTTKPNRFDCLTERDEVVRVSRERVIFTRRKKDDDAKQ